MKMAIDKKFIGLAVVLAACALPFVITDEYAIRVLNVFFIYSVVQLLLFERWARGLGGYVPRPEAVAGILPIGPLELLRIRGLRLRQQKHNRWP